MSSIIGYETNESLSNIIDNICHVLQENKKEISNINGKAINRITIYCSLNPEDIPTISVEKEYILRNKDKKVEIYEVANEKR